MIKPPVFTDKFKRSVSMLSWGYNEEELVEEFLDKAVDLLDACIEDWELVFIDDGSTDRTAEIVAGFATKHPGVKLVKHGKNLNVGRATRTAVQNATKEYLFWETVDWSYDIKNLRLFLELLNYYDVVQGVRPVPERLLSHIPLVKSIYRVSSRSDNFSKAFVSLSNYYLIRLLFGVPFHDFQNVTLYPTKVAQNLDLAATSAFLNPEMLLKTYSQGARFIEVPITFIKRTKGEAKGTKLKPVINAIKELLLNWADWGMGLRFKKKHAIHSYAKPAQLEDDLRPIAQYLSAEVNRILDELDKSR